MADLGRVPSLSAAFKRLAKALASLDESEVDNQQEKSAEVRITRLEVEVDEGLEPLYWLAAQRVFPRVYFSNQDKSLRAAGVGAAERIDGGTVESALRSIATAHNPRARFYGGMRFDADAEIQHEWVGFGGSVFVLPLWDLQVCDSGRTFLACNVRWSAIPDEGTCSSTDACGHTTTSAANGWLRATRAALLVLQQLNPSADPVAPPHQPLPTLVSHEGSLAPSNWEEAVQRALQGIESDEWSKVVLAQRVRLRFDAVLEPLHVLHRLLEADDAAIADDTVGLPDRPSVGGQRHAYLFLLQLDQSAAFIGCTPEKLFKLEGDQLSTEALAGTRPRGEDAQADAVLAQELLHCAKDLREVMAVRDFLVRVLGPVAESLEHSDPFVLQLRHVQHICVPFTAKVSGRSRDDAEAVPIVHSALSLLHPTPAVCGAPSEAARCTIRSLEGFDRGFYAGPLGYVAADSSEFCVAIRSALLRGNEASIFAGAGIVRGSDAASEWEEVHIKMKNFVALFPCAGHLLPPAPAPSSPFLELPNLNAVSCALMVEEFLRCGLAHVIMCPGSRCAPLTVAVVRSGCPHTLANDERGAGFMALGYARASGRCAAVVVSSGTAVANLLPAVVEAAQDNVPLLLLAADRPPEARDTAANQTIDQVRLLAGGPLRWFKDMGCPSADMPLEATLSDASYALARATGNPCGPVHLNCMFREPLAPSEQPWSRELLTGSKRIARWMHSRAPFCNYLSPHGGGPLQTPDAQLLPVASLLRGARRGVVVVGATFTTAQRRASAAIAAHMQWPLLPDICSGLRNPLATCQVASLAPLFDVALADPALRDALHVDVVLQIGGRLVSKRLQALVASASTAVVMIEQHGERMDPDHCVTHRLQGDTVALLAALELGVGDAMDPSPLLSLRVASDAAEAALEHSLNSACVLSEPWVTRFICSQLVVAAQDEVLFASNSLPIRHLDSFCSSAPLVLSNRGASGIDGILHSAMGVALGSTARCTLLVGDLAALHDLSALATLCRSNACCLTIVILNNGGGGIFKQLPISGHTDFFTPYFDTPHGFDFTCAERLGLSYAACRTREEFTAEFRRAREAGTGPHVIEVCTSMDQTHAATAELRAAAQRAAAEAFACPPAGLN